MNFTKQILANNARTGDIVRVINQLQDQLQDLFGRTESTPIRITDVSLVAGQVNLIRTGLITRLVGWSLTRLRGQATIWDTQDTNSNASYLALWTSANVTVDLVVF